MTPETAKPKPETLSVRQLRAARALLAWSQQDLARAADVAQSTVADFERGRRTPVPNNLKAMQEALVGAGVRFLPGGAVIGPPASGLPAAREGGVPLFRWVDAIDLEQWSQRRDGQGGLPTLLAKLIQASAGPSVGLRFPADEGIHHPGWDGITRDATGQGYVPGGDAGWELGAQRTRIKDKAQADFEKRTTAPAPLDPAESTFVFVTPHHWPGKEAWAQARRAESTWRDVRVLDVVDLVHWIEQFPAVGLWLAAEMDKHPQGVYLLREIWEEWSLATEPPLTDELVLSDRDQDEATVWKWLRETPSMLALKGESADEVAAFVHAAISSLPDNIAEHYLARAIVADTAGAARTLADTGSPLIIVLRDPEPGLARRVAEKGHHVLLACSDGAVWDDGTRALARPSREGIESALTNSGIADGRAETLARDSARSLAVLRRLLPAAPGRPPEWAEAPPPRVLTAAVLAGAWDARSTADRAILEGLAGGLAYDEIETGLAGFAGRLDSPLRKSGTVWRVASPRDAWFLLAPYLTSADMDRYQAAVLDVLGAVDPRYRIDPDERWRSAADGVAPEYSDWLRQGLGEVLILLSLFGDRTLDSHDGSARARHIVRTLLHGAPAERWWSLSRDLRLLAEASPEGFLDAIDDSLDHDDPPVKGLFGTDGGPFFTGEYHSGLTSALESLAWSRVSPVASILARLDEIDPGGRVCNRPAESLRQIFLLWLPQTNATLNERLRILKRLTRTAPNSAWKLLLGILPTSHDSSSPIAKPRWRDFSIGDGEPVTYALLHQGAVEISRLLIAHAGRNPDRWIELIGRLQDLAPDSNAAITALEQVAANINDPDERERLRDKLRRTLHRHREYPDAEWTLQKPALDALQVIYDRLEPDNPVQRVGWLFRPGAFLPNPAVRGWQEEEEEAARERQRAVKALLESGGVEALFDLAREVEAPVQIGAALVQPDVTEAVRESVLERTLTSSEQCEQEMGQGIIFLLFRERREAWAQTLLERARIWGPEAVQTILAALPNTRWTWEQAREAGTEVEEDYWKRTRVLWIDGEAPDFEFAARKLISASRAGHAVCVFGHARGKSMASTVLVDMLVRAALEDIKSEDGNDVEMFRHCVGELLKQLGGRKDVNPDTLLKLEWLYLPLLYHSQRPPAHLQKALSERPEFFIEVLRAAFKPSEESGVTDPPPDNPEQARRVATQAYRLLRQWDRVPGSDNEGQVDAERLNSWVHEARRLAALSGRSEVADIKIGEMLSASPSEKDGAWPLIAIRDVIEEVRSETLERGFATGAYNRRGVTWRGVRDGGRLERDEAVRYRQYAEAVASEWPRTAAVLERIAAIYEAEARQEDERAEQVDWR